MRPVPRCAAQLEKQGSPHPSARPLIARVWPCGPPSASLPRPRTVPASLLVAALVPGSAAPAPRPAPRWPGWMAPQRRGPLRTPEGSGATERRRPSSTKKDRELRETWRGWLKTLGLGASVVLASILIWSSLGADDGVAEVLAHRDEILEGKFIEVPCSEDYDGHRRFEGCTPRKCGRGVTDVVISREEAERIRRVAEKGLSLGGSDGGASILDLHSGALSIGKHFVNLYRYFGDKIQTIFSEEDFQLYRDVRRKVQLTIAEAFGISASSLYLTKPTFFSRINSTEARTAHDEYWHAHVDKVTYGSFDYTSLLYLSDYLEDFGGGRFVFMEEGANKTVEPRAGRVSFFTSGSENLHRVEKVRWGTRYAITIAFTCNPDHGIEDPAFT
ncbi:2-oxoglutarate and iron-dependent oxygenase domain-containing protein 3 isoform X3 [Octodon degus]|uniref:2-oxoglutarate and iron-dependent oxygenase domain-containing protein 3 n=1 Tax=Octodon degus TaxID=10160 RepID=A0A6P3F601_OCTDE|nr:2-oxoglutarate and iron-dependent oxygenase domain-containing protein 3 isoform X3 [Octodon degus]